MRRGRQTESNISMDEIFYELYEDDAGRKISTWFCFGLRDAPHAAYENEEADRLVETHLIFMYFFDMRGKKMFRTIFVLVLSIVVYSVTTRPLSLLRIRATCDLDTLGHVERVPHLLLSTHRYEHVDLFCMAREAHRWKLLTGYPMTFVVANYLHNKAFCYCVHRGACIPVRGGTTEKVLDALRWSNVCMFVYRDTPGTGAYHMMRRVASDRVRLVRIEGQFEGSTRSGGADVKTIFLSSLGQSVCVRYSRDVPSVDVKPKRFMIELKKKLYV